uniref:Uncharacterized protein n=1 Tax=Ochrobactrum sp. LM19 TaxID=1449781 RepID=A0A0D5A0L8_9HYPH|nr:hypothetical protein pLM19O2_p97 [Ochrobactrum sp. LM19]
MNRIYSGDVCIGTLKKMDGNPLSRRWIAHSQYPTWSGHENTKWFATRAAGVSWLTIEHNRQPELNPDSRDF